MTIEAELIAIRDADPDHIFRPEVAHDWARDNPSSDLHRSLLWDDAKAGYQHRLWQIRRLVKVHVINDRREPTMISLRVDRVAGGGYRRLDDVMAVPRMREMALREALADLRRVQWHYNYLWELGPVWEAVDKAAAGAEPKERRDAAD